MSYKTHDEYEARIKELESNLRNYRGYRSLKYLLV